MAEDDLLSCPPAPRWYERVRWQTWVSIISLVVSLSSVVFTWQLVRVGDRQARAAEDQVKIAVQARDDAKLATKDQADDVKRAREAAEKSASAAQTLADGMNRSASAAEISANAAGEALAVNRRALILNNQPNVVALNSRLSQTPAAGMAPEVNTQFVKWAKEQP